MTKRFARQPSNVEYFVVSITLHTSITRTILYDSLGTATIINDGGSTFDLAR